MTWHKSLQYLHYLQLGTRIDHTRTLTSSVTTDWQVHWNEDFIARDLLQNFYDANRDKIKDIRITAEEQKVVISAPTGYNIERLFYLGSEKQADDVGHYGEGFKVAATCLLRDFHVTPVARSGNSIVVLRIAETPVADTQLYPLIYDFFTTDTSCDGTELILVGCQTRLRDALRAGLSHFFYEDNPLLGEQLWSSPSHEVSVFASSWVTQGYVFYRNLRRGTIPNLPVILVVNKEFKQIENQIRNDRDRNFFGDKLMASFYSVLAKSQLRYDIRGMRMLVERARPCWHQGHPLIAAIANANCRSWDQATLDSLFQGKYFARSFARDAATQLDYEQLERQWQQEGLQGLPAYFASFGLPNAVQHLHALQQKVREQSRRPPTAAEAASIQMLRETLRELKPEIMAFFDVGSTTYTVATTETVLGELRQNRHYNSREVFLAAQLFEADFAEAFAVYVHEHAHVLGYDGSRGFTDALTGLLETVVLHRRDLDPYESRWLMLRELVSGERRHHATHPGPSLEERLDLLSQQELRTILKHVPRVTLKRLLAEPCKTT
jgi:predicted metal-dependent hydrolase